MRIRICVLTKRQLEARFRQTLPAAERQNKKSDQTAAAETERRRETPPVYGGTYDADVGIG